MWMCPVFTGMAVFENCYVLLELKDLPFKERKKLKTAVTENGGNISFVVNKQCSLVVTSDVSSLSSNRLRSIQRYQTPVVGVDYVHSCLERGVLLPVDEYKLDSSCCDVSPPLLISSLSQSPLSHQVSKVPTSKAVSEPSKGPTKPVSLSQKEGRKVLGKYRIYTETDSDLPTYPDHFQVAKYSIFQKTNSNTWCVLELQSFKGEKGWKYRVITYRKDDIQAKKGVVRDTLVFLSTSEEALEVYKTLRETLQDTGLQLRSTIPPQAHDLASAPLQQLLLEERLNTGSLSEDVGVFVELLWTEALGCLGNILSVSIDKLSLNDVSRAEGLLLQAQRKLKDGDNREIGLVEVRSLLDEVLTLLPLRDPNLPPDTKIISQTLDLCQLIRDVLNVSEMNLRNPKPSCVGKYRALRCSIDSFPPNSSEFQAVTALLQDSKVQIQQVVRVSRGVELQTFRREIGNVKPLLHSSSPSNFVGVLSRGLLLPRVGMEHHGIQRTDVGNLGSGIYFSDAVSTSLKYSKPSATDGSRLLLVCDVALGECKDVRKKDFTITKAPEGHHSVHGVRHTPKTTSEFEDDEYVVYSPDQVKLKYVVRFSVEGDQLKEFHPNIDTSAEPSLPSSDQELRVEDDGVENIKNPLEDVTAGLLDSSGQQIPLQAVHVKCKLVDMLSQVIIFQKYTNLSSVPIEAKYVFPLDDSAAVCGFEAFINGKHVVGQVKEKEKARKEYKQAIEKGHGAYLMDQDAPDVFTISVGNLPPGASVLIKVTFVSELIVRDGSILFSLPGSVAPWQESAALNQTTQVTVDKVCVTDEAASMREFTLDMSIEMPYEISRLKCITHQVKIKKTNCNAVVSVLPGEVMTPEGFQLSVTLSEVHLPRMWVEKHPDKDSQACMLVFYPDFEVNSSSEYDEVVLLLDTSESMKGDSLRTARRIALQILKTLQHNLRVNVILFGTDHTEAFMTAGPLGESRQAAETFIKRSPAVGGSTELWRPLRALSLLPPSRGVRNLLLLSDGHIQNPELTLQLLRDNAQHSRLFTCGLSPTANRHMLRALAQAGGGAFEFFDTKTKHNWTEKVACQLKRMASPGCSSVSVKWQQFNPTAPPPVQAPKQLHALFNDCHTLVYGFVPHCTQATLLGNLSGQELQTMVSTSELQKTKGTFLHKLTARALIRDYEDGSLDTNEAEHEGKKAELKNFIIELSKEFSILSQFTSFVAIEERDSEQAEEGFTDIPKLIAEEDVDFLPYISWVSPQDTDSEDEQETTIDGCSSRFWNMEEDQDIPEQDDMCFDEMELDSWEDEEEEEEKEQKKVVVIEDSDSSDDDMGFGLFSDEDPFPTKRTTGGTPQPSKKDEDRDIPEQDDMCFDEMQLDSWEEGEEDKEHKKVVVIEDSDSSDDDMGFGLFSEEDQVKLSKSFCEGPGEDIPEEGDTEDMDFSLPSPGFNRKLKKSRKDEDRDLSDETVDRGAAMLEPHYMCAGLVSTGGYRENLKRSKGSYHSLLGNSLGSMSVQEAICSPRPFGVRPSPAAARPSTVDELLSFSSSSGPPHTALNQSHSLFISPQPQSCSFAGRSHPPPPPPPPKTDAGYVPLCLLPPPQPPPPRVINARTISQGYSFSPLPPPPPPPRPGFPPPPPSSMGPPPERKHSGPVGRTGGPPPPPPYQDSYHSLVGSSLGSMSVQEEICSARPFEVCPPPAAARPSTGSYQGSLVGSSLKSRKRYDGATIVSDGAQMSLEVESLKIQNRLPQGETSGPYDKLASRSSSRLSGLQIPSNSKSLALSGPLPLSPAAPGRAAGAFSFQSSSDSLPPQPVAVNASATIQDDSTYSSAVDMRSDYRIYSAGPFGVRPSPAAALPIMAAGGFSFSSSSVPPHTALPQPPAPSFLPQTFRKCASFDGHPHAPPPPPKTGAGLVPLGSFPPPPPPLPRVVNVRTWTPPPPSSMIPPPPPPSSMIPPPPPPPFAVYGSDTNASASHLGYSLDYSLSRDVPLQAYALRARANTVQRSKLFGACEMSLSPETREISVGEGLSAPKRSARKARGFGFGKDGMGRRCGGGGGGFRGSIKRQSQEEDSSEKDEMSYVLFGSSGVEDLAQSDEPAPKKEQRRSVGRTCPQFQRPFESYSVLFEAPKLSWTKIFGLQHSEGYWESTTELGELINVDVDFFANVFLKNKGIHSLGVKAHADILRMVATLLVLQLMRVEKLEEGKLLRTLFCLEESVGPRPEHWEEVKRAVDWVCFADRQYPCVYSRLEFGMSWESSTRQLLGYEGLPPFSPLIGLTLQKTAVPLLVH